MSGDVPYDFEKKDKLLKQLIIQKRKLEDEQRTLRYRALGRALFFSVTALLVYLNFDVRLAVRVSVVAVVVGFGTLLFMSILVTQFDSLRREIRSILPSIGENRYPFNPSKRRSSVSEVDVKILSKVYDVNKNTIDKLFEKLKNFSNTWLVVAGGIASTLLIEIFKSEVLDVYSALVLIICSAFLWGLAQDLYGILNYELAKKTKDLAYWWIATVGSHGH